MDKSAAILVATYNGAQYVQEQLESVANQTYKNVHIYIRDDGSKDSTYEFCKQFSSEHDNSVLTQGKNCGAFSNFMQLLRLAGNDHEYYAFCDQDDIWMENKIEIAVKKIGYTSEPVLYCSQVVIVDENVRTVGLSKIPAYVGFQNALVENIAQGSTIVLNHAARNVLVLKDISGIKLHDWWCYLVISSLGRVLYDSSPTMYYRMHSHNVSYGAFGGLSKITGRFKRLKNKERFECFKQAAALKNLYGSVLPEHQSELLNEFLSIMEYPFFFRLKYLFVNKFKRQTVIDEILQRMLFVFGKNLFADPQK